MAEAGGTSEAAASFEAAALDGAADRYELALRGRIYADVAPQLKGELWRLADAGMRWLVVDAGGLEQIDSSGLNLFVHLLKRLRPGGGGIVFYGLNPNVERVFQITQLGTVMGIAATRAAALEALGE